MYDRNALSHGTLACDGTATCGAYAFPLIWAQRPCWSGRGWSRRQGTGAAAICDPSQNVLRQGIVWLVTEGALRTSPRLVEVALGVGRTCTERVDLRAHRTDIAR